MSTPRELKLIQQALGDIAAFTDVIPHHQEDKLKVGSPEDFLYMLATFCFDLSRRMEYLWMATKRFADQGSPALDRRVLKDNRAINAPKTWKERARIAHDIMLRLDREIAKEHAKALSKAAKR